MLLTVWLYAYLRGVLSTRAVEDRCRYDATFRVACGRAVPDHTTFSRFRRHLFGQDGLAEDLFYRVLRVCACAGLGRLTVVAGDGVKIAANASKEASRTEAGLRKLAAQVMAGAREAAAADEADTGRAARQRTCCWARRRCRGRIRGRGPGGCWPACRTCRASGRPPRRRPASRGRPTCTRWRPARRRAGPRPRWPLAAAQLRLEVAVAAEEAALADWQARRAAGQRVTRPPARPGTGKKARKARARLEALQAAAAGAGQGEQAGDGKARPRRNVTDPDSRLLPVRGGGFTQGYNCQDAAADDRLMLGGYACQDTGDVLQAQGLAAVAEKGAAVVAAGARRPRRRPRPARAMPRPAVHPPGGGQARSRTTTSPPATTP